MAKSKEPIPWSLFSAGGVISAFCLPALIFLTGIAVPLGWLGAPDLLALLGSRLARLFLFVVIFLCLFHWAHRFRAVLVDLGLRSLGTPLALLCYGTAIAGTIAGGWLLLQL